MIYRGFSTQMIFKDINRFICEAFQINHNQSEDFINKASFLSLLKSFLRFGQNICVTEW